MANVRDVWALGAVVFILAAQVQWFRYVWARADDPDRLPRAASGRRWLADRFASIAAWEYSILHQWTPSRDAAIEHRRRAYFVTWLVAVGWLVVGFALGPAVDAMNGRAGAVSPGLALLAVMGEFMTLVFGLEVAVAAAGPGPRLLGMRRPVVGLVVGLGLTLTAVTAAALVG